MTTEALHILQHSLGVDQYGLGTQYRNHFCTGERCKDWNLCNELVQAGFMEDRGVHSLSGEDHVFVVTESGKRAMTENSPTQPKLTRSQKNYIEFLDFDGGISFHEWLLMRRKKTITNCNQ